MAVQDPLNRTSGGFDEPLVDAAQEDEWRARIDLEAGHYPASRREAWGEVFDDARSLTERTGNQLVVLGVTAADAAGFDLDAARELSAEEANDTYGVDGYLRFDRPVTEIDAWNRSQFARRQLYRERAVSSSDLPMLDQLGAGLLGSLTDPLQLPLWLAPEAALGNWLRGLRPVAALPGAARFGVAGAAEGAAGGALYEGLNLPLRRASGEDYGLAEASISIVGGALFGTVVGSSVGALAGRDGPAPGAGRPPREVEALTPERRVGAFRAAMDSLAADEPVNLGPMLQQAEDYAGRPRDLARLDEAGAPAPREGWRMLDRDVAVTTRGTEIPVRYAVVELDDLTTSHTDDLFADPAYPAELQPRQRERAAAQARNRALETELNPLRLMGERGAESGAPIVSADGVVESGNGRTIALRRSANGSGTDAYARYTAALEKAGYDLSGMTRPVLVRVREQAMSGADRVRLTREMNADVTERYSATEQALADAEALSDEVLALMDGSDPLAAGNRAFVRRFIQTVAPDQMNAMIAEGGGLSKAGVERLRAALTAKAYGDQGLVETLFEAGDDTLKGIGRALADAAADWTAMRGAMARGEVPAELDLTANLRAAVDFVRHARQRRIPLGDLVAQRLGQLDAFSGEAISAETEGFLRAMFQTSKDGETLWSRPRAADKIADGLRWLARETMKVEPGPNLFGEVADTTDARRLLYGLAQWFAREAEPDQHPLAFAVADEGQPDGGAVRAPGGDGAEGGGGPPAGEGAARPEPVRPDEPAAPPRLDVGDPMADPEIRALHAEIEGFAAREGLDAVEIPARDQPDTVRAAFETAAACILGRAQ